MIDTVEASSTVEAEALKETEPSEMPDSAPSFSSSNSGFERKQQQKQQQQQQHQKQYQQNQRPSTSMMIHSLQDVPHTINAEMVMVTLSLFLFSILILSPRGSIVRGVSLKRRRCTPGDNQYHHLLWAASEDGGDDSNRTTTTNSTGAGDEEETDEEKFHQVWPAIRTCGYRRLVLPPDCRLVDIPEFMKQQREEENIIKNKEATNERKTEDDADHPLTRLKGYSDDLFHLSHNFLSFDFMGVGWMLINWIQRWLRIKSRKPHEVDDDPMEDDDDDMSESTEGNHLKRNERVDLSLLNLSEEKKDDGHQRSSSASDYGSVMSEEQLDVGHPKPPLSPRPLARAGKKKDALDNYRLTPAKKNMLNMINSTTAPLTPRPSIPLSEPVIPDMKTPVQDEESSSEGGVSEKPSRASIFSSSMSFFDTAHNKASLRRMHVEVPVPDRNGYILGDDFLPNARHTPLIVFVNSRSGPRQGQVLIGQLRRLLNPIQVWDLADGGPERVLESFCALSRLRILVCGGDGTVSWIISCLEKMQMERWPPMAILPLGTGNDLARIHGWGGGYTNESLIEILQQVAESYISLLDQWEMKIENKKGTVKTVKSFFNYVGVGADAQAALQVHMLRESKPQLFFSRLFNKMWYLVFGAEEAIKESNINLPNEIILIADGVKIPLPPDSQGIILLNIDSYSGGVPIWSHGEKGDACYISGDTPSMGVASRSTRELDLVGLDGTISPRRVRSMGHFPQMQSHQAFDRVDSIDDLLLEEDAYSQLFSCNHPSSCQDGKLDIVSVRGTYHLGQIQVGLGNATKLCQASEVKIIMKKKLVTQIDGEPWRQSACTMTITRKKDQAVMLHRSADESGGVETEMAKLLDWAEDRRIIDRNVHSVLMKEFSRRIESKTRQRRVRSQDNLMLTLKRAIASGGQHSSQPTFPGTLSF